MTRTRVLPVLVLVVLAGALAALSAPATAAYPDPGSACDDLGQSTVVVVFPDGTRFTGGDEPVGVYPSTEFRVFLCRENRVGQSPVSAWGFPEREGFQVTVNEDADFYRVRVNQPANATASISLSTADHAEPPTGVSPVGPTVTIEPGNVVPARYSLGEASVDELVYFEDGTSATAFRERRNRFHGNVDGIAAAVATVNGSRDNASAVAPETIQRLGRTTPGQTGYAAVRETLAPAAVAGRQGATASLQGYTNVQREAVRTARWTLQAHRATLAATAERNARSVLLNLLGTVVLGLLLGAGVGWYVTKGRVDEVAYQRVRTSSVDFDLSLLRAPVGAAVVLAVVSVALVVATGLLGPFVRVLLAVLP